MSLGDRRVPARQSHEAFCEINDTTITPQECDLIDRVVGQWWLESFVHLLDEVRPWWRPGVEL
jgi:hypothetical protein